jgi:hypothetical protein
MADIFQGFESYLEAAEPAYFFDPPPGGGGHPGKFGVALEGGVSLLGKPANTLPGGDRIVRSEAAAWQVAKLIYCTDMVSTTVLRTFVLPNAANTVECSVQVIWPAVVAGQNVTYVDPDQLLRAGAFDYVISGTDRTATNNWLMLRSVVVTTLHIMLIDNGFAFGARPGAESVFVTMARGNALPPAILQGVENLQANAGSSRLNSLLDGAQLSELDQRCATLLDRGFIP